MAVRSHLLKIALAALTLSTIASPAAADVELGVNAWSRGEYETAVKQWRDPALKGDADAQFNMGQAYKMGRGVKTDLNVALDWYKRAAAQGHLQASDSYGHLLHYQGKVPEALPYLKTSSDRGDPRAQYLLATELFNGITIQKDWVRAYALMTRASSAGLAAASNSLSQMDQYIPLEQRQAATVLAGELEQRANKARTDQVAGFPINTTPPPASAKAVDVPPSKIQPGSPSGTVIAGNPPPKPAPAPAQPVPQKPAATDGAWRVQLGAFGEVANAKRLWDSLEGKVSGLASLEHYLKTSGNITRLQAGPFATRTAADAMCAKVKAAGQACLTVPR
jgi:uncharacterized protein